MDKIQGFITIPVEGVLEIVSACSNVIASASNLIKTYSVPVPEKEASSKEKPVVLADPKKEASSEDDFVKGLRFKKDSTKPFEMVIE